MMVLRTLRLLKMVRLVRLWRGMRTFRRWEMRMDLQLRHLTLVQLMITTLVVAHWISCLLGAASSYQGQACVDESLEDKDCVITWLTTLNPGQSAIKNGLEQYFIALHTASTILVHPHSSTPTSTSERILFICLVWLGGFAWTKVISRSTAIWASLCRQTLEFNEKMDNLTRIGAELGLSSKLRRRLRCFFRDTAGHTCPQHESWSKLFDGMSPQLRKEVSRELNRAVVKRIPFLKQCSSHLVGDIAQVLDRCTFAQGESFGEPFTMYIMRRGLAARGNGCVLIRRPGAFWGEEHLLLMQPWLLDPTTTLTLTFIEVLTLTREAFSEVVCFHPDIHHQLRMYYLWYFLRQALLHQIRENRVPSRADRRSSKTKSWNPSDPVSLLHVSRKTQERHLKLFGQSKHFPDNKMASLVRWNGVGSSSTGDAMSLAADGDGDWYCSASMEPALEVCCSPKGGADRVAKDDHEAELQRCERQVNGGANHRQRPVENDPSVHKELVQRFELLEKKIDQRFQALEELIRSSMPDSADQRFQALEELIRSSAAVPPLAEQALDDSRSVMFNPSVESDKCIPMAFRSPWHPCKESTPRKPR
eukprot:gnl/MRDRNA2_/MRDRNA2_15076_c0_seq1.p1 gnl/MRDRNA2_/MRDRNA2_15076_c0~~gnl/MRDRNA2_/MRDRNA2_15076_c0_seq1.p1  ORF type:complete len:590 (+),score=50.40 gnl/MRDRNA2_/MRDRNA2_15076_c0_seq1:1-1770(+)